MNRQSRLYLGFSILFIILGGGNIIFGAIKAAQYRDLVNEMSAPASSSKHDALLDVETRSLPSVVSQEYLSQVKVRLDFYRFVALGGKWMLAIAGFFLLVFLVTRQSGVDDETTR